MQLTAILTPAVEGGFIAMNPETGTHTRGNGCGSFGEFAGSHGVVSGGVSDGY